jgi:hypothetical protein
MVSPARSCLICKGARALCGLQKCPVLTRFSVKNAIFPKLKEDFFGQATSVFIGRHNYPNVFIGPLAPLTGENARVIDSPSSWFGMDYSAIIGMRSALLRSKSMANVLSVSSSRIVSDLQEIALASRPPDVEMHFKGVPVYRVSFSDVVQPMGPSATLKKLSVTENIHVERHVERIVSDEMPARQAGFQLYRSGEDVYRIGTILSSGALGMEDRKRLVPTRWSITASQTMVADMLIGEIKQLPEVNEFRVYSSSYLDNHFEILLMPGKWEFENFEAWAPGTPWSMGAKKAEVLAEYEPNGGRTTYAELQGGGFYASRLGVAEGLKGLGRQARVAVFREVHEGYVVPLGVWQVLENVRNAFRQPSVRFGTKEESLGYIGKRLRLPLSEYIRQSVILRQKRLHDFMKAV